MSQQQKGRNRREGRNRERNQKEAGIDFDKNFSVVTSGIFIEYFSEQIETKKGTQEKVVCIFAADAEQRSGLLAVEMFGKVADAFIDDVFPGDFVEVKIELSSALFEGKEGGFWKSRVKGYGFKILQEAYWNDERVEAIDISTPYNSEAAKKERAKNSAGGEKSGEKRGSGRDRGNRMPY